MTLTYVRDPEPTAELRAGISRLWTEVSNAGGAVGFVPPVTEADVLGETDKHFAAIARGRTRLLVGYAADGRVAATAFICLNDHRLMTHWAVVSTVMVDPALQGQGHGADLIQEVERCGRELGLEALRLGCRGGTGVDRFYAAAGYKEAGRVPAAIRVAPGDDRDDITMWLPLL